MQSLLQDSYGTRVICLDGSNLMKKGPGLIDFFPILREVHLNIRIVAEVKVLAKSNKFVDSKNSKSTICDVSGHLQCFLRGSLLKFYSQYRHYLKF